MKEIKTVPFVPFSHPFVERLVAPMARRSGSKVYRRGNGTASGEHASPGDGLGVAPVAERVVGEMALGQAPLDGVLAFEQPVHGGVEIVLVGVLVGVLDAGRLGEGFTPALYFDPANPLIRPH